MLRVWELYQAAAESYRAAARRIREAQQHRSWARYYLLQRKDLAAARREIDTAASLAPRDPDLDALVAEYNRAAAPQPAPGQRSAPPVHPNAEPAARPNTAPRPTELAPVVLQVLHNHSVLGVSFSCEGELRVDPRDKRITYATKGSHAFSEACSRVERVVRKDMFGPGIFTVRVTLSGHNFDFWVSGDERDIVSRIKTACGLP